MRAAVVLSLGLLCSVIVTTAAQTQDSRRRRDEWVASAGQSARVNPLAGRLDAEPGGKKVFHQRCTACHGEDATGTNRGPDLTVPRVQRQSDGALFWKITSGNTRTGMPTFSFLPEPQRWQLIMHLRSRGRDSRVARFDPAARLPSRRRYGHIAPGASSQPLALGAVSKPYHCSFHPSMVGSLNAAETPEPPPCTGYCG
jgi:mono/diheme cytochrome c family protein